MCFYLYDNLIWVQGVVFQHYFPRCVRSDIISDQNKSLASSELTLISQQLPLVEIIKRD